MDISANDVPADSAPGGVVDLHAMDVPASFLYPANNRLPSGGVVSLPPFTDDIEGYIHLLLNSTSVSKP